MRRILLAVESSACSREALHPFIASLGPGPAELFVLSVVQAPGLPFDDPRRDDLLAKRVEEAEAVLDAGLLELAAEGRHARPFVRVGEPVQAILALAQALDADLIVMGSHGFERDDDRPSVAEGVLHGAHRGVLIYPPRVAC